MESAGGQQHAQTVVLAVAVAARQAAVEFDEAVDRFGAAVVGSVCVAVDQERQPPFA